MSLRLQPIYSIVPVTRGQGVRVGNKFGVIQRLKDFDEKKNQPIEPPVVLVRFPGGEEIVELYELHPVVAQSGSSVERAEEYRNHRELATRTERDRNRDDEIEPDVFETAEMTAEETEYERE